MKVSVRVQAFPDTPAVLFTQGLAAKFGRRRDVDDVMSQGTIDVVFHRETVFL